MREILFRGKDFSGVINHSWCFGSLDTTEDDRAIIIYLDRFGNKCRIVVNPETVGQYTGLKDKNGTKIFEGDIIYAVSNFDAANMVVVYDPAEFRLVLCEDYKTYKPGWGFKCLCYESFYMEVVGNIYDNPELLEGDNNG